MLKRIKSIFSYCSIPRQALMVKWSYREMEGGFRRDKKKMKSRDRAHSLPGRVETTGIILA